MGRYHTCATSYSRSDIGISDDSKFGADLRKCIYQEHAPGTLKGAIDGVKKVIEVLDYTSKLQVWEKLPKDGMHLWI